MSGASLLTPEHQAFHAHLDICRQCREHPFALCRDGHRLVVAATASCLATTVLPQAPR